MSAIGNVTTNGLITTTGTLGLPTGAPNPATLPQQAPVALAAPTEAQINDLQSNVGKLFVNTLTQSMATVQSSDDTRRQALEKESNKINKPESE